MSACPRNIVACSLAFVLAVNAGVVHAAERIVSIGGDVTEIVFALGLGDQLVAVDSTSRYPAMAGTLPDVGYMRSLSAEPILALAPSHILAVEDAGPESTIRVLRQAGVKFTSIPDSPTVDGLMTKIQAVAEALDAAPAGEELANDIQTAVAQAIQSVGDPVHRPRALFLLSIGRGGLMAGGRGTSAHSMIRLAGGQNVAAAIEGYKPFEPEAMNAFDPEVLIVTERTLAALGGKENMVAQPQFSGTSAARTGRIVTIDGTVILGFGPRLPEAIETLAKAIRAGEPDE